MENELLRKQLKKIKEAYAKSNKRSTDVIVFFGFILCFLLTILILSINYEVNVFLIWV